MARSLEEQMTTSGDDGRDCEGKGGVDLLLWSFDGQLGGLCRYGHQPMP